MHSLFSNVSAQKVDADGKVRIVHFDCTAKPQNFKASLFTSPLPPLPKRLDSNIYRIARLQHLTAFLAQKQLRVTAQNRILGDEDYISGVWVTAPAIAYGFVPLSEDEGTLVAAQPQWDNVRLPRRAPSSRCKPRRRQDGPELPGGAHPPRECKSDEDCPHGDACVDERCARRGNGPPSPPVAGSAWAQTEDPVTIEDYSRLADLRQTKLLAHVLKQYVLFLYSKLAESARVARAAGAPVHDEYDEKGSFSVVPDHRYDVAALGRRLDWDSAVMFASGGRKRLIVASEAVRKSLASYLAVRLKNDFSDVVAQKDRQTIPHYFRATSDFTSRPATLVFAGREAVAQWKHGKTVIDDAATVFSSLRPDAREPYYYRNCNIKVGRLVIVQNVRGGDLALAKHVSNAWLARKINLGFDAANRGAQERAPSGGKRGGWNVDVYTQNGLESGRGDPGNVSVVQYTPGAYAALLFT